MKISCTNWKPAALDIVGYCELKKSHVTLGTCIHSCTEQDGAWRNELKQSFKQPTRGLGDVIAAVTSAVGIKPCGGCKQRQETLNKIVPFK